ncbi:uncharacterized protein V1516DRAFT_645170 [Lipomyces oligophaga]|uniref:uncharacterized protein n=1 Tax=Lipomyces oligophaga TaxID=45792 RepID=UPI0034CD9845
MDPSSKRPSSRASSSDSRSRAPAVSSPLATSPNTRSFSSSFARSLSRSRSRSRSRSSTRRAISPHSASSQSASIPTSVPGLVPPQSNSLDRRPRSISPSSRPSGSIVGRAPPLERLSLSSLGTGASSVTGSPLRGRSVSGSFPSQASVSSPSSAGAPPSSSLSGPSSSTNWPRRIVNVILELDLNCNVIWGSKSWPQVVGVDIQSMVGKSIADILVGDQDVFQKATDAMLDTNSSYRVRFTAQRTSDLPLETLQDSASPVAPLSAHSRDLTPHFLSSYSSAVTSRSASSQTSKANSRRNSISTDDDIHQAESASVPPCTSTPSTSSATPFAPPRSSIQVPSTPRPVRSISETPLVIHHLDPDNNYRHSSDPQPLTLLTRHASLNTTSWHSEPTSSASTTVEMEGQGIIIFDRHSLEPVYSMWVLKPYIEPKRPIVDLPQLLIDSLGFGADVLAGYLSRISQSRITDPRDLPAQDLVMCRICERQIQPWWFERHSELCLVEHKAENDVQTCQDLLRDHRNNLSSLLQQLDTRVEYDGVIEYRGQPIVPPPLQKSEGVTSGFAHIRQFAKGHKSPIRLVEMLIELCDMAMAVKTPALRENLAYQDGEDGYQLKVYSPDSESLLRMVLSWKPPSNVESEGVILMIRDTEGVTKGKVDAILRLGNTITYAEKIQRELSTLVQECVEETMAQVIAQENVIEEVDEDESAFDEDIAAQSDIDELNLLTRYLSGRDSSPGPADYNSRLSVASGSSPRESISAYFSSLSRPKSRKVATLLDEEGADSDSSRSSLVNLREKADSPVSDSETSRRVVRKGSLSMMFGSPHRQKSPALGGLSKSPLLTPTLKRSSVMDGATTGVPVKGTTLSKQVNNSVGVTSGIDSVVLPDAISLGATFTPLTSPLLFPIDSYSDRRRSSTASEIPKPPLSPLLTSVTPSVRPAQPSIRDFEVIKPISKGAFGSVYLTKKKNTGEYFAIKVLKKSDMIAKNQVTNVKAERAIMMAQAESPFVAKLFFTFQSKEYLYLVMEYLNGGDCAALIKAFQGGLPQDWVKQYIAEVVLGIENLHDQGIVHRDLKPDNLLIDKNGHLKLTDFGLSRMGLIGRQARRNESVVEIPPDLFDQTTRHFRTSSSSSAVSSSMDTPLYVDYSQVPRISPDITPLMAGTGDSHLPNVPGYFSLNKSLIAESGSLKPTAALIATPSAATSGKGESITSMLNSFSLHGIDRHHHKHRGNQSRESSDEAVFSTDSDSGGSGVGIAPDNLGLGLFPTQMNRSASSAKSSNAPATSMGPPPLPNMVLFDPANGVKKFVGTPDYLAPETIMGTGQDKMSDWWSLGCIVFEFLYGYPPFHAETPTKVFENILARRIAWPDVTEDMPEVSGDAVDLINRLICTDPEKRLGARSAQEVKQHPFFSGIDWDNVLEEDTPFHPEPIDDEDTAYFDDRGAALGSFPEEELEDSSRPAPILPQRTVSSGSSNDSLLKRLIHSSISAGFDRMHDHGANTPGSAAMTPTTSSSRSNKLLPLHIPHHFRGRRMRRLSEPVDVDDFGSFAFKNLNVLEKANKDVIERLKTEHMEQMKAPVGPVQPSGLIEPSPIKPRSGSVGPVGLIATGSAAAGRRAVSPSSSTSSGTGLIRMTSPSRGGLHGSMPSSPLTAAMTINSRDLDDNENEREDGNNDDDDDEDGSGHPNEKGLTRQRSNFSGIVNVVPPSPLAERRTQQASSLSTAMQDDRSDEDN